MNPLMKIAQNNHQVTSRAFTIKQLSNNSGGGDKIVNILSKNHQGN